MAYRVDTSPLFREIEAKGQAFNALAGLAGSIKQRMRKNEIEGLVEKARAGDPEAQNKLFFEAPEISRAVMQQIGAESEAQQKGMIYDFSQVVSLDEAGRQDEALSYLDERIKNLKDQGRDTRHSEFIRNIYAQDPETGGQYLKKTLLSMMDPKGFAELLAKGEQPAETKMMTIYGPEGATKQVPIEQGVEYVPPEGWSLTKPGADTKQPTTAMGAFLNQNPDATPDEIADFAQKLKAPGREAGPKMTTIYGPNGETKQVPIPPGKEYAPPTGWSLVRPRAEQGTQGFAPETELYINSMTGESKYVNVRDQKSMQAATDAGYSPVSPESRGYGLERGKASAKREEQINTDSSKARSQITTLTALDQLLDRFETGKLTKIGMKMQQYASAFGLPVDLSELGDKEAFNALTEQLALQSRNMGEGMVLAGQMSDRDVQFLRDMNVQLIISKGGNKKILNIRKAIARRNNQIAELMRQYKKENKGRFDSTGFDAYLEKNFAQTSIFGIPKDSQYVGNDRVTGLPVYQSPDNKYIIPSF